MNLNSNDAEDVMGRLAPQRPSQAELAQLIAIIPQRTVVRQICMDGTPHAFRSHWHHWERIREIAGMHLSIHPTQVRLTGSANHGYSWKHGKEWDPTSSDLDLFLIDRRLYASLAGVARAAHDKRQFDEALRSKWRQHAAVLTMRHLRRGFVQTDYLLQSWPELQPFTRARLHIGKYAIRQGYVGKLKKVSFRIYRDASAAEAQLKRSLESAQDKLTR